MMLVAGNKDHSICNQHLAELRNIFSRRRGLACPCPPRAGHAMPNWNKFAA